VGSKNIYFFKIARCQLQADDSRFCKEHKHDSDSAYRAARAIDKKEKDEAARVGRQPAPSACEYTKDQLNSPRRATQFLMTKQKRGGGG
jgi:hypothetical protein